MENHAGREELKAAEGAGVGISVRPSETLGTRLMYAAVRTQGGEYIRVAMQYNGFLRDLVSLLPALLGAGLVAFAVAAFVATRVAKTVTDPISDFTESLKNVQEGGARLEPEKYPFMRNCRPWRAISTACRRRSPGTCAAWSGKRRRSTISWTT